MKQRLKIFTSFVLTWTFIVISLSGLALFLSPQGRIANWVKWELLGFTKTEWGELHTVFVSVFLIAGIFHLFYFNWKAFLNYFKKKIKRGTHFRYELIISLVFCAILLGGTMWKVPVVFSVVKLGEDIKASYEVKKNEPPIPHAEDMTIEEFSTKILSLPLIEVVEQLENNGFTVSGTDQTIAEIAELHDVAPSEILSKAKGDQNTETETPSYFGYGRKTLGQVCSELHVPMKLMMKRLNEAGITETDSNQILKKIADRHDQTSIEIIKIITREESIDDK